MSAKFIYFIITNIRIPFFEKKCLQKLIQIVNPEYKRFPFFAVRQPSSN